MRIYPHLVKAVGFGMKFIEWGLIGYPEDDENGAGNADGETGYINKRVEAIFPEVSEGDDQIVFKHGRWFISIGYFVFWKSYRDDEKYSTTKRLTDRMEGCMDIDTFCPFATIIALDLLKENSDSVNLNLDTKTESRFTRISRAIQIWIILTRLAVHAWIHFT